MVLEGSPWWFFRWSCFVEVERFIRFEMMDSCHPYHCHPSRSTTAPSISARLIGCWAAAFHLSHAPRNRLHLAPKIAVGLGIFWWENDDKPLDLGWDSHFSGRSRHCEKPVPSPPSFPAGLMCPPQAKLLAKSPYINGPRSAKKSWLPGPWLPLLIKHALLDNSPFIDT